MLLALDSSLGNGSVALYLDGKLLNALYILEKGAQAKLLVSTIGAVLTSQNVRYSDLDSIVCTVGPGGFTGIRIALSAARAIAFTAGKPIYGVSTLSCLAYGYLQQHKKQVSSICAVLPAGKGMVFLQHFNSMLRPLDEPRMAPLNALDMEEGLVTSQVSTIFGAEEFPIQQIDLDAKLAGALASDPAYTHLLQSAEPLYIRPPDISKPKAFIQAS